MTVALIVLTSVVAYIALGTTTFVIITKMIGVDWERSEDIGVTFALSFVPPFILVGILLSAALLGGAGMRRIHDRLVRS